MIKGVLCPPKRLGEEYRKCQTCGAEFEPNGRNQVYCSVKCRPSERKEK